MTGKAKLAASYSVYYSTPRNAILGVITDFVSLKYVRSVNNFGVLTLVLPGSFDRRLFRRDSRLEIWRHIHGKGDRLETNTQWLVMSKSFDHDAQQLTITAYSGLHLLQRRIIAYAAGTTQANKSGAADDVIVEYVKENMGSDVTDTERDWSSLIDINASPGNGANVRKTSTRRNLLKTCQEVAQQSAIVGTPIFFDMEYNTGSRNFEFKTFANQRGQDFSREGRQVILSPDLGSLARIVRSEDHSSEVTYAYALGQGQGEARQVETASDIFRINYSPFGRIEDSIDARNTSASANLIGDAQERLRKGRPVFTQTGTIINLPGATYGVDWNWGDKIIAQVGDGVDDVGVARIDTVEVTVSGGNEVILADIRVEEE